MVYDFDEVIERNDTGSLKWDYREEVFGSKNVIPMWVADMDFRVPQPVIDAMKKRAEHGIYGYPAKTPSYYNSIIGWMERRHGWKVSRDWISTSPGVVPAINLCVQAFSHPGDKIVVQSPVYYPFFRAVENNGRRIVKNPLNFENGRYTMDFEDLEKNLDSRTRMLILCNPHNPVGRVWTREELSKLGEICLKHDLIIISDEIHEDLVYEGHRHIPIASVSEELAMQTVTCTAPSKTFNIAGLSTSTVIAKNEKLLSRYEAALLNAGLLSGNVFGIVALEAAYTYGEEWLDQLLVYLKGNVDYAEKFINERIPRIKFVRPEGTYLALIDFRDLGMDQDALNEFVVKEAGIGFDDGAMFGKECDGFERINLACPRSTLKTAMENLEKAVGSL